MSYRFSLLSKQKPEQDVDPKGGRGNAQDSIEKEFAFGNRGVFFFGPHQILNHKGFGGAEPAESENRPGPEGLPGCEAAKANDENGQNHSGGSDAQQEIEPLAPALIDGWIGHGMSPLDDTDGICGRFTPAWEGPPFLKEMAVKKSFKSIIIKTG